MKTKKIAIVGGGISGLAAAQKCRELDAEVSISLFEASKRTGGVLQTESAGGYLIEKSADMFTTDPPFALDWCERMGKSSELVTTLDVEQRAFIATSNGFEPVPNGFSLMLPNQSESIQESALLDAAGKQRFFEERNVAPSDEAVDESLEDFAVRRFGQQAFDHLIQPLVGGIYTADPKRLSMMATLERFRVMERKHGSLLAAAEARRATAPESESNASGARYGLFRAPERGMGQIANWLVDSLKQVDLQLECPVVAARPTDEGWLLEFRNRKSEQFDAIVLATPACVTSSILGDESELGQWVGQIDAASSAVVVMAFDQAQLRRKFGGFGIVFPHCLGRRVIAFSFSSNKFPYRAPERKVLIRTFVGGALQSHLLEQNYGQLEQMVLEELDETLGIDGSPELTRICNWKRCMPQYELGHLERVANIKQATKKLAGLELTGNSYEGVGVPVCLQSGLEAADRTISFLRRS